MTETFNLIDEPWILVVDKEGGVAERSIREVLTRADGVATVCGDLPTQQFAITRLLLAIARRAVQWGDDPLQRWEEIWQSRSLPTEEIESYLDRVHPRFDLLDTVAPFYQVPEFHTARGETRPIGLLVSDWPGPHAYFTTRAGPGAVELSLAETARWLVHTQAYDASGIKTGSVDDPRTKNGKGYPMGIAWAGQLGGVLLEGTSLFDALLLNTVLQHDGNSTVRGDDLPVWERPPTGVGVREDLVPTGPVDLLTWQSRRIHVIYDGGKSVGVLVGNGDPIEAHRQRGREFLTGWRHSANKTKEFGVDTYYPRTFDADRSVWEGFEGLLTDTADGKHLLAPGVVRWLDLLVDEGMLAPDAVIAPHTFGLRYDTQASVIGAAIDDRIPMRVANFGRGGCRRVAIDAVRNAEAVARAVGALARDLAVASGGEGVGERLTATTRYLAAVDGPYRHWLTRVGVEDSDQLRVEWHRQVYEIASRVATELVHNAGRPAFVGRQVDNGRGASHWIDASTAERFFRAALRRELPGIATADGPSTREVQNT